MPKEKTTPSKPLTATQVKGLIQGRIETNGGGDKPVLVGSAHVVDVEFQFDESGVDGNVILITEE